MAVVGGERGQEETSKMGRISAYLYADGNDPWVEKNVLGEEGGELL